MSYNSLLLIPTSNVASPIVTPVILVGSPMVVELQVEAAPPSSLYLSTRTLSRKPLHDPSSSQSFPQPSSALYLPHPSPSLYLPQPPSIPVPVVIHASPSSEVCIPLASSSKVVSAYEVGYTIGSPSRCPLCSSNSDNNWVKVGLKRLLWHLFGGQC